MTEDEILTLLEKEAAEHKDEPEKAKVLYAVLDKIDRVNAPKTYEEACERLTKIVVDSDITDYEVAKYHHGLGTWIRNHWGLWKGWELHQDMKARFGLGHADDMSGLIMEAVECQLNGREFDIEGEVEKYKKHWERQNINPLTQERLN